MPQHGTISCDFTGAYWLGHNETHEIKGGEVQGGEVFRSPLPGAGGVDGSGQGLSFTLAQTVNNFSRHHTRQSLPPTHTPYHTSYHTSYQPPHIAPRSSKAILSVCLASQQTIKYVYLSSTISLVFAMFLVDAHGSMHYLFKNHHHLHHHHHHRHRHSYTAAAGAEIRLCIPRENIRRRSSLLDDKFDQYSRSVSAG